MRPEYLAVLGDSWQQPWLKGTAAVLWLGQSIKKLIAEKGKGLPENMCAQRISSVLRFGWW